MGQTLYKSRACPKVAKRLFGTSKCQKRAYLLPNRRDLHLLQAAGPSVLIRLLQSQTRACLSIRLQVFGVGWVTVVKIAIA